MSRKTPLVFIRTTMEIAGMIPYKFNYLFMFFALHEILSLGAHLITSAVAIFLVDDFWNEAMEAIQFTLSAIHIYTKLLNFLVQRKKYIAFFEHLEDVWTICWSQGDEMIAVLEKGKQKANKATKFLLTCFLSGCLTQLCTTSISNYTNNESKLPFQMWVPSQIKNFFVRILIQEWMGIGPSFGDSTCCSFYRVACVCICSIMIVLQESFQKPFVNKKIIYTLHQEVIKLVQELNELHSGQAAFEVLITSILLCIRGYSIVKAASNGDVRILSYLYILFLCLITTYLICDNGTMVATQSEKLHRAAYQSKWYEDDVESKKNLLILQTVSRKPITLNYKQLITFDMIRFSGVLQGTYSYLTMLKFFDV